MSISISSSPFFSLSYGTFECKFIGDESGGLSEIGPENELEDRSLSELSIKACTFALTLIEKDFNESCCTIGIRLGWTFPYKEIGITFTRWIQANPVTLTLLDLSNLNLKLLPPQITPKLFPNVEKLNLRGNDLRVLQNALQFFHLKELDIRGNKKLQPRLPAWLSKIEKVKFP